MTISIRKIGETIPRSRGETFSRFETKTSLRDDGRRSSVASGPPLTRDGSSQTQIASLPSSLRNLHFFYDSLQASAGHLFQGDVGNLITKRVGSLVILGHSGRIFAAFDSQNSALSFSWLRFPQPHFRYRNGGATSIPLTGETDAEIAVIDLVKRAAVHFASPGPLGQPQLF
jgi:hypothetical protein